MRTTLFPLVAGLVLLAACSPMPPEIEEGFVTTPDGIRLYYQKIGGGPQTVIAPAHLYLFEDLRRLGDQHTLIAYDMRNRGRSDRVEDETRITIDADVEDLETVRRHFGADRFTPVGYSYLGLMVVMYAMEHPDRVERIVQLGPVPLKFGTQYLPEYAAPEWEAAMDPEGLAHVRKLREENRHETHPKEYCEEEWNVTRFTLVGDPAKVERVPAATAICEMENEWPVNLARHFGTHFVSVQQLDIPRENVTTVDVPVLTIHGTKDRNAPYGSGRDWAYLLPDARILTIEGAAHQSFSEAPEVVVPAIETFIAGDWPAGSEQVTVDPRAPEETQDD